MEHIAANGVHLYPGDNVQHLTTKQEGMWDGPCTCDNCKSYPNHSPERGTVLGVYGSLEGSFLPSELLGECEHILCSCPK